MARDADPTIENRAGLACTNLEIALIDGIFPVAPKITHCYPLEAGTSLLQALLIVTEEDMLVRKGWNLDIGTERGFSIVKTAECRVLGFKGAYERSHHASMHVLPLSTCLLKGF